MKKKVISITLALALALGIGVITYAATGNFTMTYLPGTSDTVTNMPANDDGMGGQAYSVSATTPQREGYEFIGWELDYSVAIPEEPRMDHATITLTSYDLFGQFLQKDVREYEVLPDTPVVITPVEIRGYSVIDPPLVWDSSMGYEVTFTYIYVGTEG